ELTRGESSQEEERALGASLIVPVTSIQPTRLWIAFRSSRRTGSFSRSGLGEFRSRRIRTSPQEQERFPGNGGTHLAVRGSGGPGLGERYQQPRPAVHERREILARSGRRRHRTRPFPPAARGRLGQPRLPLRHGYDERPNPEVCYELRYPN